MVAVAAALDEPDFGVDAFEAAVGEAFFGGGADAVEVGADGLGQVAEGGMRLRRAAVIQAWRNGRMRW